MPRDRRAAGAAEAPAGAAEVTAGPAAAPAGAAEVTAGPTAAASSSGRIAGLVAAEIRIMLQGVSRWWYLVALGLALACLFVPLPAVRGFLVPIALVWPLLVWSPMGSREAREGTRDLLFSTPRPLSRLLVAQWLAGATVALAAGSGALVRFALAGQGESLLSLVAAAVFIPSLALALGSWSGSGKLFEVIYLVLWYAGPMNRIPALDYLGATGPRGGPAAAATVLLLGAALAALAVAGRRRQLLR